MDEFTTLMFVVFTAQALYIVRLQYFLDSFKARTVFLQNIVEGMLDGNVVVSRTRNGFQVISKGE